MGRAPCCDKIGLKKGPWTAEEDQKLTAYINEHGHGSWRALPKKAGLLRCGKSCRLRWTNYLRPDIKRGEFTASEEQTIIQLHALLGNRWSAIASHLPKRTDNEIKNYWNTHLKKRLLKMGIDPVTHKPKVDDNTNSPNSGSIVNDCNGSSTTSSMSHMAQWESVRLEAEARLAREAEMRSKGLWPNATTPAAASTPSASTTTTTTTTTDNITPTPTPWSTILSSSWNNKAAIATSFTDILSSKFDAVTSITQPNICFNNSSATAESNNKTTSSMNAIDLMTMVQNWEKSLQGQAGMMWPESWQRLSSPDNHSSGWIAGSGELQESSSCSSPHYPMNHGSPTSTLSSLDQAPKHQLSASNPEESSHQPRKLSWSDHIMQMPLDHVVADGSNMSGFCGMPSLQAFMEMDDGLSDMKREIEEEAANPILASVTNSSSFLGELELVSEDISSSHQSSSNSRGFDDDQHEQQISYSALLNEEDYADCDWNSVLKEVEGSDEPMDASF